MIARRSGRGVRRSSPPWLVLALAAVLASVGCSSNPTAPPPDLPPGAIAEVEPNDSAPQSLGTLDATDKLIGGTASGRNDVDLYSVTLAAPGSIYMSLGWTGAQDLEVGVTDQNGIMIHNQDGPTANPEQCTVTGRSAGTYRVRVGSRSSSSVGYLLTIGRR